MLAPEKYPKIFPVSSFGSYKDDDLYKSKVFSLCATREAVLITEYLKNIQEFTRKPLDLLRLVQDNLDNKDFANHVNQPEVFHGIVSLLSKDLLDELMKNRAHSLVVNKFGDSFLFDSLLNVLVLHLSKDLDYRMTLAQPQKRKEFMAKLMEQILAKSDEGVVNPMFPGEWLEDLKSLEFEVTKYEVSNQSIRPSKVTKLLTIKMAEYVHPQKNIPQGMQNFGLKGFTSPNSNIMLYGTRGSGKSGVLNFLQTWAYENGWVTIKVPSVYRLTQEKIPAVRHEESRLYLQTDLAKEILKDFAETNKHLLNKIPVNLELYGFINIAGCHEKEPEPVPNTYDEWNQSKLYDSDKFLFPDELNSKINDQRDWRIKLSEKEDKPKTLAELCALGEKYPDYCTAILGEIMEQLRNLETHPVLCLVDDYNYFYRRSCFPSFRYETKLLRGTIPPYHMALCRLFMRMDGHKFKNGFKAVASSHTHLYKHVFVPERINFPEGFGIKLEGQKLNAFRQAICHYSNTDLLKENYVDENLVQQFYGESQGNWHLLHCFIRKRCDAIDMQDYKFDIRKVVSEMSKN